MSGVDRRSLIDDVKRKVFRAKFILMKEAWDGRPVNKEPRQAFWLTIVNYYMPDPLSEVNVWRFGRWPAI